MGNTGGDCQQLRLLSLDGGGVRGLSSLLILKKLLESVAVDPDDPPKVSVGTWNIINVLLIIRSVTALQPFRHDRWHFNRRPDRNYAWSTWNDS